MKSIGVVVCLTSASLAVADVPRFKRGLIVYSANRVEGDTIIRDAKLFAIDPEAPTKPIKLHDAAIREVVVGAHLVAGLDSATNKFWVRDLRAANSKPIVAPDRVDFLTIDDRVVSRCSGGLDEPFAVCTAMPSGADRRELYREAASKDTAVILGAGRSRVLAGYLLGSTKPAFSIARDTGARTDHSNLVRRGKQYTERPALSPSGDLAVTCPPDDGSGTILVTDLVGKRPVQKFVVGNLTRCECAFSRDDRKLACSVLVTPTKPNPSEGAPDQLVVFDLASGQRKTVSDSLLIGEFAFSPDGNELAHISTRDHGKKAVLAIVPVGGGPSRDLMETQPEMELDGWTDALTK